MESMFKDSQFNGDISQWNVSSVKNMDGMFMRSLFNCDTSNWKPYSLQYCKDMFRACDAPVPWWYAPNPQNTIKVLNAQRLNNVLEIKPQSNKKIKI